MKETFITTITAIGTGLVTTLLGGWDRAMEILLICMVLDYLTGVAAAIKTKELRSSTGFEGLAKKGSIFIIVILAAQLDRFTGNAASIFRTSTAFFFVANEGLSIIENVGELGIPLPSFIKSVLEKMKEKNDAVDPIDPPEDE